MKEPKPIWTRITLPEEAQALLTGPKYREDRPTTMSRKDGLWALVDAQFQKWRAEYSGKRS